jgi:hypothetical protein
MQRASLLTPLIPFVPQLADTGSLCHRHQVRYDGPYAARHPHPDHGAPACSGGCLRRGTWEASHRRCRLERQFFVTAGLSVPPGSSKLPANPAVSISGHGTPLDPGRLE